MHEHQIDECPDKRYIRTVLKNRREKAFGTSTTPPMRPITIFRMVSPEVKIKLTRAAIAALQVGIHVCEVLMVYNFCVSVRRYALSR
jgi:hypothetical protein